MDPKKVQLAEAQSQPLALVALAESGTEVLLVEGHTTRARLAAPAARRKRRIPGLHPGSMVIFDDFDAPLPDGFWLGEE